jgi:pimeloyl-ACP methyl ester carboxylesterase
MTTAPILFVHGVPADGRLWDDLRAHLPPPTAPHLVPSLPGYGGGPDLSPCTVDAHVEWLLDRLPSVPVHIVGQDYGGLLGARLTVLHPCRVRSLTLISAPVGLGWSWAKLGALPGPHLLFYRAFGGGLWHHQGVAPHRRTAFADTFGAHRTDPSLSHRMRTMALGLSLRQLARLPGQLRTTQVPLLTLWGTSDRFCPWPAALWMAQRHRSGGGSARTVLVPGGRHYLPFGRPKMAADALQRFWTEVEVD